MTAGLITHLQDTVLVTALSNTEPKFGFNVLMYHNGSLRIN